MMNSMNSKNNKISLYPTVWGPRPSFGLTAQKSYPPVSLEPEFQFSKTSPHFMWNVQFNKMYYLNIRIYLQLGVWGLKTSFGLIGPKRLTKPED